MGNALNRLRSRVNLLEGRLEDFLKSNVVFFLATLVFAGFAAILRLAVAFSSSTAGPDYGHYLIAANWYLGADRSGEGPFDPPFVPVIIIVLAPLLGKILSLQILGPLSAACMLPAAAYLLDYFLPRWVSLLASLVFVLWQQFTEFITVGGATNLFGIAFSLVFFRMFFQALESPSSGLAFRKVDLGASVLGFLIVSTHHFTAFITVSTVVVWVVLRVLADRERRSQVLWTAFRVGFVSGALSAIYASYLFTLASTDTGGGFGQAYPISGFLNLIGAVWKFTPELWAAFLVLGMVAFVRFRRSDTLAPFAVALLITPILLVLTILRSHPVRSLYFEEFPIVFLASLWAGTKAHRPTPRNLPTTTSSAFRVATVALLLVSIPLLSSSVPGVQLAGMATFHQFLNTPTLDAFDWIQRNTAPNQMFAVDGGVAPQFNDLWKGMALGWWLEGYANRRAIYEANPVLLPFQSKWEDARDANRLFAADTVFEDGFMRVADSFPRDDAAWPLLLSDYLQDYHEVIGFAAPRVVNLTNGSSYPLVLGADPNARPRLTADIGILAGNFSGPGFHGARSMAYHSGNHTAILSLKLQFDSVATWDGFELTLRLSPTTEVKLGSLANGTIPYEIPHGPPFSREAGVIQIATTNLSGPQAYGALTDPEEVAHDLRWTRAGDNVSLNATLRLDTIVNLAPQTHPLVMKTARDVLSEHATTYLFVATDSQSNTLRFYREQDLYIPVFLNSAVTIFRVR